jgi:ABC-type Zn uptake system ZnuABC Zn-binding protein ZnuA
MNCDKRWYWTTILVLTISMLLGTACADAEATIRSDQGPNQSGSNVLSLPSVEPVQLDARPLRIIVTTSIIGDVVGNVSGSDVELITLMAHEQDPHSFEPSAGELTVVSEADVVFINGWDLEEGLEDDLATIAGDTPVVAVGAKIDPLVLANSSHDAGIATDAEHDHGLVDPHTWYSVPNVKQWVENISQILGDLDPVNAANYENNAQSYLLELEGVDNYIREKIANIPVDKRILVANHGVFNYLAQEYGFQIVGTIIPSTSTQAEPTASDLADLIKEMEKSGVCTIFSDIASNDNLAKTVAMELSSCDEVEIVPLHTGTLGPQGSGADSYIGMLKTNVDRIVEGLE